MTWNPPRDPNYGRPPAHPRDPRFGNFSDPRADPSRTLPARNSQGPGEPIAPGRDGPARRRGLRRHRVPPRPAQGCRRRCQANGEGGRREGCSVRGAPGVAREGGRLARARDHRGPRRQGGRRGGHGGGVRAKVRGGARVQGRLRKGGGEVKREERRVRGVAAPAGPKGCRRRAEVDRGAG